MSNFFDNFMGGMAFGMLANNPFFGGCFGFGMYPMYGGGNFGGFANPFPSIFGNMGYMNMAAQPMPTTFANAGFPAADFTSVGQTIWDYYTNPNSEYNKQLLEMLRQRNEQSKSDSSGKDNKQYIPQIEFPFSSFYMPSSISVNPWVTGYMGLNPFVANPTASKSETKAKTSRQDNTKEASESDKSDISKTDDTSISYDAKALKDKWSKKQPHLTDQFYSRIVEISQKIKCNPEHLMAVINLESAKSFSPSKKNPTSSATGLIQFTSASAQDLGTTVQDLAKMSALEQLDYVEKYLVKWKKAAGFSENETLAAGDLYALVFQPAKAKSGVLASAGTKEYNKNKMLDVNKDNKITTDDLSQSLEPFMA